MLDVADIEAARDRIMSVVRHTPMQHSPTFSSMTGADIHLKLENTQRTGAFKIRGATNRIATLSTDEQAAGVVTASAGNHAQGVALAASRADVDATIVMPEQAPVSKVEATERYGGDTVLQGTDYDEAQAYAHQLAEESGQTYVHAFDDAAVMAGQGTIGLEIIEDCPDVETVVVPVGGGGLIAGIATAVTAYDSDIRVIGVQAEGAASAPKSLATGSIHKLETVNTIADGIATRRIGDRPFAVIEDRVDDVVTVTDDEIAVAVTYILERSKTLVEGAGAVAMAAILADACDYSAGETIVPALCGGNIDMNRLTTVLIRGLVETGRYLRIRTVLEDYPGALEELVAILADYQANIYAIQHDRTSRTVEMNEADVEIDLETRGHEHIDTILSALRESGYTVEVLV